MDFGLAIVALKLGKRVQRAGWNGKGMWIEMVAPHLPRVTLPFLAIRTPAGDVVPWVTSQMDVLAEDWSVVE
jgi:hypothetical protein